MKHKLMIAIGVGCLAAVRTTEELWFRTSVGICEVAAWAAVAYIAGIAITYAVAEKFHQKGGRNGAEAYRKTARKHPARRGA